MRQVTCQCGAVYERTEQKVIFKDQDSFKRHIYGWEIESWSDSQIPIYQLVKRPGNRHGLMPDHRKRPRDPTSS